MPKADSKKSGAPAAIDARRAQLSITQIRSGCQAPVDQKACLRGLGLRRIRHTVVRIDTPDIRGMILKVRHLVTVEPVAG